MIADQRLYDCQVSAEEEELLGTSYSQDKQNIKAGSVRCQSSTRTFLSGVSQEHVCQVSVKDMSVRCQSGVCQVHVCQVSVKYMSVRCQSGFRQVSVRCQPGVSHVSVSC